MSFSKFKRNRFFQGISLLAMAFYLLAAVPMSAFAASASTKIKHEPIEYYISGKRIAVEAEITDDQGLNLVRLYFKNDLQADYLFVPMTSSAGDIYTGILPAPDKSAKTITYLFLVVNSDNVIVKSQEFSAYFYDDDRPPAWQEVAADDQITLYSELPEMTEAPAGFTDSIAMDAVESGARFGMVAGGIYLLSQSSGTASATGTAASATSGGTVTAGAGGLSALAIGGIVAGAAVVGAGAVALSDSSSDSDSNGSTVHPNTWSSWTEPSDPEPGESVYVWVDVGKAGVTVEYDVDGTDGYHNAGSAVSDQSGRISIYIPGGSAGVTDTVHISVPEWGSGFNKTFTYVF